MSLAFPHLVGEEGCCWRELPSPEAAPGLAGPRQRSDESSPRGAPVPIPSRSLVRVAAYRSLSTSYRTSVKLSSHH